MANTKISDLPAIGSLADSDLFVVTDDVAGTPVSVKLTAAQLFDYIQAEIVAAADLSAKHFDYFIPLSGVTDNEFHVAGVHEDITTGETGDYTTDFSARGHHVGIHVNTITTGGDIVITGTSVTETNGVPTSSDTETITVDTTADQMYQTSKKWLEITNVDTSTGTIASINYDIFAIGYLDRLNVDFGIVGFRMEFRSTSNAADIRLIIEKVQDDGDGKMSIVTLENIGIDSTSGNGNIYDNLRTSGDDRSYTYGVNMLDNNEEFVLKYNDYYTYFTSDENIVQSGTKDEGIIIRFQGEPSGGLSNVDHCTLNIFYRSVA